MDKRFLAALVLLSAVLVPAQRGFRVWCERRQNRPLPVRFLDMGKPDAQSGLMKYLSFNAVQEEKAGARHALLYGTRFVEGKQEQGLAFDGKRSYVDLGPMDRAFTHGLTIAFWAYPIRIQSWSRFVDFGNEGSRGSILFSNFEVKNDIQFQVMNADGVEKRLLAKSVISLNEWQHFAGVLYPDGRAIIYKNGAPVTTGTLKMPEPILRKNNYLGKSNLGRDDNYAGKLDEFYLFDRPLEAREIQALMEKGRSR